MLRTESRSANHWCESPRTLSWSSAADDTVEQVDTANRTIASRIPESYQCSQPSGPYGKLETELVKDPPARLPKAHFEFGGSAPKAPGI
jgi:hypothetical protein